MGTHPIFESDFDCLTEKMSSDSELEEIFVPTKKKMKQKKIPDELREWIEPVLWKFNKTCMKSEHRADRKPLLLRNYRDLEDGYIVAVMIKDYCPKVVQTHNLTRTLKRASKVDNWAFVSQRLWIKTGFNLDTRTIDKILDHESSVLFETLLELKHFLEENFAKDEEGSDKSSEVAYVDVEKYIPSVLDSPKAKRPLSKVNVKVLDKNAKVALQRNDTIFKNNRKCVQELRARFNSLQSDVQERNNEIIMLESSARPASSINTSESSKKKSRCCCVIS